ncbi:MAG TPA: MFS transporter [Firmicutes bacterium]|nr:MFS transporter [Bacillota bacterium]
MGERKVNRYLTLLVLALGAVSIYLLPYLRWTYYDTLVEAVNLSNAQFAATMSIFGVTAMIFYAPGGYLADKLSLKKMLSFAFLSTGLLGLWYATFPGFVAQMLIFGLWGGIGTAFFWSAMMKVTRTLGSSEEQGRMFGLLEGSRGLVNVIIAFVALYFYGKMGESVGGMQGIIVAFSILCIISAVLAWIVIPNRVEGASDSIHLKDVGTVLKIPAVWIIALIVMTCYSVYIGSTYLTPYMTEMLGLSATLAGAIAILRTYALQCVAAPTGGAIADKIGSVTLVIGICFVIIVAALAGFVLLPASPSIVMIALVLMLLFCAAIFAMRGIYFAPMDECNVPKHLTGTAVGVISVIGFFPDVYMNAVAGTLMDAFPGAQGYKYLFIVMLAFAIVGTVASIVLSRMIKKHKQEKTALDTEK